MMTTKNRKRSAQLMVQVNTERWRCVDLAERTTKLCSNIHMHVEIHLHLYTIRCERCFSIRADVQLGATEPYFCCFFCLTLCCFLLFHFSHHMWTLFMVALWTLCSVCMTLLHVCIYLHSFCFFLFFPSPNWYFISYVEPETQKTIILSIFVAAYNKRTNSPTI